MKLHPLRASASVLLQEDALLEFQELLKKPEMDTGKIEDLLQIWIPMLFALQFSLLAVWIPKGYLN